MNLRQLYYEHKFDRIARRLGEDYPRGRSSQRVAWDLFTDLETSSSSDLFLGVYGDLALMDLFHEFGLINALAGQGIHDPQLQLDLTDAYRHVLRFYDEKIEPEALFAELVFRRARLSDTMESLGDEGKYPSLHLEWILLQNPHRRFGRDHPMLPGQEYPGLALGDMVLSLIAALGKNLRMSAMVTVPASIHSALFFLKCYYTRSPAIHAQLLAAKRAVKRIGRTEVIWAEHWGDLLEEETGAVYHWEPAEMIQPLRDEIKAWFDNEDGYQKELHETHPHYKIRDDIQIKTLDSGEVLREVVSGSE
ncbi:MAG: hypothetical protein JSU61_05530 [Fidelibacterota bacterium]|nr:MAG: hypothetical protein JSU61_05530 [Candidatus Neomarinimicrobiota bacterium]